MGSDLGSEVDDGSDSQGPSSEFVPGIAVEGYGLSIRGRSYQDPADFIVNPDADGDLTECGSKCAAKQVILVAYTSSRGIHIGAVWLLLSG